MTGAYELTAYMMAIMVAFAIAYSAILKTYITVEVVVSRLPKRAQAIIDSITCLIGVGLFSLIAWQSALLIKVEFDSGHLSENLLIPTFPFVGAVALGLAMFFVVLVTHLVEFLSQAVRK